MMSRQEMKYPRASHTLKYYASKEEGYDVDIEDILMEGSVSVSARIAKGLRKMDGKNTLAECFPHMSRREAVELLKELDEAGLLFRKNPFFKSGSDLLLRLYIPKKSKNRYFAKFVNAILQFGAIPIAVFGIYFWSRYSHLVRDVEQIWKLNYYVTYFFVLIISMFVHELGHFFSAMATEKAAAYEFGVGFRGPMFIAYTLVDTSDVKSKGKRAQIMLAGLQANLLIGGLGAISMIVFPGFQSLWHVVIFTNFILAVCNFCVFNGLDGEAVISRLLFEEDSVSEYAKEWVKGRKQCRNVVLRVSTHILTIIIMLMKIEAVVWGFIWLSFL